MLDDVVEELSASSSLLLSGGLLGEVGVVELTDPYVTRGRALPPPLSPRKLLLLSLISYWARAICCLFWFSI